MGLRERIQTDMKGAMKAHRDLEVSVLRMLMAAIKNKEIERRGRGEEAEMTEEETAAVVKSEVKKRRDAAAEFENAGRRDLAEKEKSELPMLARYLPVELSDEEIERILLPLVEGLSVKDFGRVMQAAMKEIAGRASGDRVSALVRRLLK